jgi:hypothetical protein
VFRHSVFGVRLECDFPLPELPETGIAAGPTWRVETHRGQPPIWSATAIGWEVVQGDVVVRAYAAGGDFRLVFDDTGTFDVRAIDRSIVWYPGSHATDAAVRADLLGRVIALAAHADGRLTLHASAVSVDGQAIAFLGPKHAGKSTIALALVRGGARLLADDAVVIRLGTGGQAWAAVGVQRPRLWTDSVHALDVTPSSPDSAKPTVELPPDRLEGTEVPLRACYILNAVAAPDAAVARGARLAPVHAALSLVGFSKIGALLGGTEAAVVLERAAALAEAVPTYVADVARDLRRLDDVAAQLLRWHGSRPVPNVALATPSRS